MCRFALLLPGAQRDIMMQDNDPNKPPFARPVTIREAARRLGVSERTVYRRLRSGKLRPALLSDMSLSDVSMSVVTRRQDKSHSMSENRQNVSINDTVSCDSVTLQALESLRDELRE